MVFKKDVNPFVVTDDKYDAQFVLGILASSLISYLYLNPSPIDTKDNFRQTTLGELRVIPVATPEQQAGITALVEQTLAAKTTDATADTSALEAAIDVLVYRLYVLEYPEVLLVDTAFGLSEAAYGAGVVL